MRPRGNRHLGAAIASTNVSGYAKGFMDEQFGHRKERLKAAPAAPTGVTCKCGLDVAAFGSRKRLKEHMEVCDETLD